MQGSALIPRKENRCFLAVNYSSRAWISASRQTAYSLSLTPVFGLVFSILSTGALLHHFSITSIATRRLLLFCLFQHDTPRSSMSIFLFTAHHVPDDTEKETKNTSNRRNGFPCGCARKLTKQLGGDFDGLPLSWPKKNSTFSFVTFVSPSYRSSSLEKAEMRNDNSDVPTKPSPWMLKMIALTFNFLATRIPLGMNSKKVMGLEEQTEVINTYHS